MLNLLFIQGAQAVIELYAKKSVPIEEVVKVMNIAKRNKYKMILATSPERD